ncbi:MAG: internal scaffolding protein [Arizlama microvirus]|nr:MAG: internal scaffolding protein [Arizlama microvirus]
MKYERKTIDCSKDGLTQQQFRKECDINYIVDKARTSGLVTNLNKKTPFYGDVSKLPDYQTAQNLVILAEESFMSLDARIRERFNNDPGKMMAFLSKKENKEEAIKLGLINPPTKEGVREESVLPVPPKEEKTK